MGSPHPIYIDGKKTALTAYTIGGNNYFKLRDIGKAFDFEVKWNEDTKVVSIHTFRGYTEPAGKRKSVKPPDMYTLKNAPSGVQLVCIGLDENYEPVLTTEAEWIRINSEEYILATGESRKRTSYAESPEYEVKYRKPDDGLCWTRVEFWWEPVSWTCSMYGLSDYFEWELYCSDEQFNEAKGNALEFLPDCPDFETSYNLFKDGEFVFSIDKTCGKYGKTALYVRRCRQNLS